jgi:signal transduction histidine kinase
VGLRKCLSALTIAGLFSLSAIPAPGADRTMPDAGVDRQTRTFVVASSNNLPPINFLDGKGDLTGFAREISTAVARAIDADTRYLHSSHYPEELKWLETGKADLIHDTAYSEERALFLDFTDPILEMPEVIFTRADQVNINGFGSLRGKSVAAVRQHISHLYLEKYPEINLHLVGTPTEAFYLLVNEYVDAFVYPKQVVAYMAQELRIGDKIKIVGDPLRILRYSMVVKKGNKEVLDLLNEGIRKIRASGEYDRIYHRWFGERFLAGYSKKEVEGITAAAVTLSLLAGIAVSLLVMNVTLRKTKNQLSETVSELRSAGEERERLQAHLQQAMKMEAVGRLAGGVAHDFNNLLTVITGYSELLLQKIGTESPMHREVEEIRRAGERAASLTQQLLAFSRKQIIEPRVVRLDLLVAEMHKMLTRLIGEDIALQATTGKSLGSVKVDPGQFQQILMNLAVNARDAMPGGGKIAIETANVDLDEGYCAVHPYVKPGRFVMLAVSDTGQGMSKEVKEHIFEPFFTTKERGSGTGLGLATTYGVVKQAGARSSRTRRSGSGRPSKSTCRVSMRRP